MSDDFMREARERWTEALDAELNNRTQAEEDLKFAALEQWDENVAQQRRIDGRPCLVMDRIGQVVRQVTGDARLNPPGIKVRPVDNGSDPAVAETLTGLIRNIEASSNADTAYISALESAARCGMGFLRVTYDYTDDGSFDMELRIENIKSPFAVLFDPYAQDPTRADSEYCFVSEMIPLKAYKKRYPKAALADWDGQGTVGEWSGWREGNAVRVADYWKRDMVRQKLVRLADGRVLNATELGADAVKEQVLLVQQQTGLSDVRERTCDMPRVTMHRINGVEELEDAYEWPGIYIPVVPVWGEMVEMGGRTVRRGLIRAARDPQIRYNAAVNAVTEYTMTMNKGKRILPAEQIEGHEAEWATAHLSSRPYLVLNSDGATPTVPFGGVPVPTEPPPAGLLADVQLATMDIEAATGIYRDNLGKETNAQSGRAILSRQREGDVGSFLYVDNLARAVSQIGRICVDTIPRVYDTPRTVRILGEDGSTEFAPINTWDPAAGKIVNDLSQGKYDVVASVGPAFSTRREEGREFLMNAIQANPAVMDLGGDILMDMMDAPGAEKLAKRFHKRAVAMGIAEPEDGEQPPGPPPPDPNMLLAQAEMMKAEASMMKAQGDAAKSQAEAQVKMAELALESQRVELEKIRVLTEAQKTGAEIQQIMADVRNDTVKTVADVRGQHMDRSDRRLGMMLGERRADMDRGDAERREIRGHQARREMAQRPRPNA